MDFLIDQPFSEYSQRFYISSYKKLLVLNKKSFKFREHISKIAYMYGDMNPLDIYDVLRMYGLLYCPQMERQINSYDNGLHPYNPRFYERWNLFDKYNPTLDDLPSVVEFIEVSDKPLPTHKLFKKGAVDEPIQNILDAEYVWDEMKLQRLRQTHGYYNIDLVEPFKELTDKKGKRIRRYEWNKR